MPIKTETRDINGKEVIVSTLPAPKAKPVLLRLSRTVAKAFGPVGDSIEGNNIKPGEIGRAFQTLIETGLDEDTFNKLEKPLLDSVLTIDGVKLNYTEHFSGEFGFLMKVLMFSIEVNFQDFFTDFKTMLLEALAALGLAHLVEQPNPTTQEEDGGGSNG